MKGNRIARMVALYIVVGMVLVGCVALTALYHHDALKMTSSTTGQVVSVDQREVRDENERREETVIVCRYQAAGRDYEMTKVLRGRQASRFPTGSQVPIRYNPGQPEMSRIVGI